MTSPKIKRRGAVTPTTVILVLFLLGAVVRASMLVSPPPKDPAPTAREAQQIDPAKRKAMELEARKQQSAQMAKMMNNLHNPLASIPKVEDPHAVTIDNTYFLGHKPGEQGLKQVDAELVVQTAKYEAYKREVAAFEAKQKAKSATTDTTAAPVK
jgi:hypothetical protein